MAGTVGVRCVCTIIKVRSKGHPLTGAPHPERAEGPVEGGRTAQGADNRKRPLVTSGLFLLNILICGCSAVSSVVLIWTSDKFLCPLGRRI